MKTCSPSSLRCIPPGRCVACATSSSNVISPTAGCRIRSPGGARGCSARRSTAFTWTCRASPINCSAPNRFARPATSIRPPSRGGEAPFATCASTATSAPWSRWDWPALSRPSFGITPTSTAPWRICPPGSRSSRRALQPLQCLVDLEPPCLRLLTLLALAFDHLLRRALDEVGIGELGIDAGDVRLDPRHLLLERRLLGGEIDDALQRQARQRIGGDDLRGGRRRLVRRADRRYARKPPDGRVVGGQPRSGSR